MKLTKIFILLIMAATTSCAIVDLEEPPKANITLTTDWNKRTAGIAIPASYTVVLGSQTLTFTQATNRLPELNAGTYPIHIYTTCDKISISGTTATVRTNGNEVHALPDWYFTATSQVSYTDFETKTIEVAMQQQIKQVTIDLVVSEGDATQITSLKASLTGVANSHNCKANTHSGANLYVSPVFVPVNARSDSKLTTTVRLLGVTNEVQKLNLDLTLSNGSTQSIESDVSKLFVDFNTNKHIPLHISANLSLPVEAGFAATITEWETSASSGGVAW